MFVSGRDGNGEVYAMDANGSSPRNLTQNPANDVRPCLVARRAQHRVCEQSKPGRLVANLDLDGAGLDRQSEIYVMNADGSRKRNLTRRASDDYPTWSPDGRRIAFLRGLTAAPRAACEVDSPATSCLS